MSGDTCADCGSSGPFKGIEYPSTPNGPAEYDMQCEECGSTNIAESASEAAHALGRALDSTRAEVEELKAVNEKYRTLFYDPPEPGEDLSMIMDRPAIQALVEWTKRTRATCDAKGTYFDTGFRCVSEGGTIWEFDPEEIEELWDELMQLRRSK